MTRRNARFRNIKERLLLDEDLDRSLMLIIRDRNLMLIVREIRDVPFMVWYSNFITLSPSFTSRERKKGRHRREKDIVTERKEEEAYFWNLSSDEYLANSTAISARNKWSDWMRDLMVWPFFLLLIDRETEKRKGKERKACTAVARQFVNISLI